MALSTPAGAPSAVSSCMGQYTPTGLYKCGHPVYQRRGAGETLYLFVPHGYVCWRVSTRYDSKWWWDGLKMMSPCATGHCPAHPRNMKSKRFRMTSWWYKSESGRWDDCNVSVTCDTHQY